jgi:PAS domain S-box-containing protein
VATVVERRVHLDPRPESARRARRMVAAVLVDADRGDLVETAELLVSELVTNAVVHARTAIDLVATAGPEGLRVAVHDGSAHLPSRRHYGRAATTGRGLELVSLLARRHGTDIDDAGKTVWFEIGTGEQEHESAPAASGEVPPTADRPVEVHLLGVPVMLVLAWRQHVDTLLREHLLAQWEAAAGGADVVPDGRAHDAFAQLADALGPLDPTATADRRADVRLSVTGSDAEGFAALDLLLEDVIARAQQGQMLAPATQPEIRLLRRWVCDQVRDQVAGRRPARWPGLPSELATPGLPSPAWDTEHVRTAAAAVVGGDDLNQIVAASPAALELLGWDETLVGRRIGEIVPARLRESHIAGFTRHLLTGDSRIMDTEVQVPALRRDGTEIEVLLLVHRENAADGRPVFTATLRPVEQP